MNRKLTVLGTVLLVLALFSVVLLCTNTRIDPQIRKFNEISRQPESENADMNLLLQIVLDMDNLMH